MNKKDAVTFLKSHKDRINLLKTKYIGDNWLKQLSDKDPDWKRKCILLTLKDLAYRMGQNAVWRKRCKFGSVKYKKYDIAITEIDMLIQDMQLDIIYWEQTEDETTI